MKTIDSNKYENFLKRLNKAQETETIIYYKITSPIFNDSGSMVIDEIDDKNVFNKLELKDILSNNSISIDKIHLLNVTREYINPLKRISSWFNIPVSFNNER